MMRVEVLSLAFSKRMTLTLFAVLSLVMAAMMAPLASTAEAQTTASGERISGQGNSGGVGGWFWKVDAQLLNGLASGKVECSTDGINYGACASGDVTQVVPPSSQYDFWCITVERTDNGIVPGTQNMNFYINDIGDGSSNFDQWQYTSGMADRVDCTTLPEPSKLDSGAYAWQTLDSGNFRVAQVAASGERISGQGNSGGIGGWFWKVDALLADGLASGKFECSSDGVNYGTSCASGDVKQVVPPSAQYPFWCINITRSDGDAAGRPFNFYINDVGNGITKFDQWQYISGNGDCTTYPEPSKLDSGAYAWQTLDSGDFLAFAAPYPAKDSAKGSGTASPNGETFSFDATSDGGGRNPAGTITFNQGSTSLKATVDCLTVSGDKAIVTGKITESTVPTSTDPNQINAGQVGNRATFWAVNKSYPGAGQDLLTASFGSDSGTTSSPNCNQPDLFSYATPIQTGEITVFDAPSDTASQNVSSGETVTTAGSVGSPTADNPVNTSVTTPNAGQVTITENLTATYQPPSSAYTILGQVIQITAPDATIKNPLILKFKFDSSVITAGESADTVRLLRNGTPVPPCENPSEVTAVEDPCVFKRMSLNGGDVEIDAYTSKASEWAVAAFHYDFTGFSPPVANAPTLNEINGRAGKVAIPVKFSLGSDQGLNIFEKDYPSSKKITCPNQATAEVIEQTVAPIATADEGTLKYDPTADQYIYTWNTKEDWKGTCRELNVKLKDGSERKAQFKFVK